MPRRILLFSGLTLCLALYLGWFASRWYTISLHASNSSTSIRADFSRGQFHFLRVLRQRPPGPWRFMHDTSPIPESVPPSWLWNFDITRQPLPVNVTILTIPLWFPFLLVAAPTGWLLYRRHRHIRIARERACPRCQYPREGLAADTPCPECGRKS